MVTLDEYRASKKEVEDTCQQVCAWERNNLTACSPVVSARSDILSLAVLGRRPWDSGYISTVLTCSYLKWEYTRIPLGRSTCLRKLPLGDRAQA